MRILLVHNTLNDSVSISGVLREYVNMANVWVEDGHQVDFLSGRVAHKQLGTLAPKCGLLSSDDFFDATAHMDQSWRHFPAYARRCLSALRLPKKGYDVIYATCPFVVETYCARKIAGRLGVPWVIKIQHVLSTQAQRTGLINRLLLWGETKSAKWANRDAAKIFCLSPPVSRDYKALEEQLGLEVSDTETIGSSINLDQFSVLPGSEKKYDVVFLGRMHLLKGVFDLPDVWDQVRISFPEATLTVIGEGPHRGAVMAQFAERGLMDGVRFVGSVPEGEKNRLLSEARIGLSLSSEEGWGLAVNEYLACGLSVVAYDLPVFHEVFPDLLQLVPLGEKALAAQSVLELLANPDICEEGGQIGREYVQRYNYREMALQELEHLRRLCIA